MHRPRVLPLLVALALGAAIPAVAAAQAFDHAHPRLAAVLERFVVDDLVDYAALKADPATLDAYLGELAAIPPADFAAWSHDERLATLVNLYNAATLRLIIDHHPIASIRRIGLLPGAAWRQLFVRFGGQVMSLDHLEHKIIRVEYDDARVHFALVCAAMGCPPLRGEPFVAARLDAQFDEQGRIFLATPAKNRFDPATGTLWISPIFDWFKEDFTKGGRDLPGYVAPFLPAEARAALERAGAVRVRFTDYDWALNEVPR